MQKRNNMLERNNMPERHFTVIIPSRYESTRLPGKPLAMIAGKSLIQRVCNQASQAVDNVWVATDNERISAEVSAFGGHAVMTGTHHRSGTDRLREAADKLMPANVDPANEVIINVQGDEPFIDPKQIKLVMDLFKDPSVKIATLARKFTKMDGIESVVDPNVVKVVMDNSMNALYFSRSPIPYVRGMEKDEWLQSTDFYAHIGIYAYTLETLREITELKRSSLETAESLEQLRWLQNGYKIRVALTDRRTIGIDTPADLEAAIRFALDNAL